MHGIRYLDVRLETNKEIKHIFNLVNNIRIVFNQDKAFPTINEAKGHIILFTRYAYGYKMVGFLNFK